METEALRQRLNSALEFEDWTLHNEYKSIFVLAIYWEDGDMPGFKEEAYSIGTLFATAFHYDVDYYAIPSEDSHMELDRKINAFISEHRDSNNLIIIHYGGHGDPDDETAREKLAVWQLCHTAAQRSIGPSYNPSLDMQEPRSFFSWIAALPPKLHETVRIVPSLPMWSSSQHVQWVANRHHQAGTHSLRI